MRKPEPRQVLRSALSGAIVGLLLSVLRVPDGTDWMLPGEATGWTTFSFHLLGYVAAAFALARAFRALGESLSVAALAWGLAAGFAAHALFTTEGWSPRTLPPALVVLAALVGLNALILPREPRFDESGWEPSRYSPTAALLAVLVAQSLVCDAPLVRDLGLAHRADDALAGSLFALLIALGASAASPLASVRGLPRFTPPLLLFLACIATFDSARALDGFAEPGALAQFLARAPWSTSPEAIGQFAADSAICARLWTLPALALGAAFALAQPGRQRASIALGLAAGSVLGLVSPARLLTGSLRSDLREGYASVIGGHAVRYEIVAGRLVVHRDGLRWTPGPQDAQLERTMLASARDARSLLFVGILTPERKRALDALGVLELEVTSPFARERRSHLVDNVRHVDLDEARARDEAGHYDVVLVAPVGGAVPRALVRTLGLQTRRSVWFESSGELAGARWSERIDAACPDMERVLVALTSGSGELVGNEPSQRMQPWTRLATDADELRRVDALACAERIARAQVGTENERAAQALVAHLAAQKRSPPTDNPTSRVELDLGALEAWSQVARPVTATRFQLRLIGAAAEVLSAKRELELIERFVLPVAEGDPRSAAVERALGMAELEMLDPEAAAERFSRALALAPRDEDLLVLRARTRLKRGDSETAARELERALAQLPESARIRREFTLAAARAGRPGALEALRELAAARPDDAELHAHASGPPWPELELQLR